MHHSLHCFQKCLHAARPVVAPYGFYRGACTRAAGRRPYMAGGEKGGGQPPYLFGGASRDCSTSLRANASTAAHSESSKAASAAMRRFLKVSPGSESILPR